MVLSAIKPTSRWNIFTLNPPWCTKWFPILTKE